MKLELPSDATELRRFIGELHVLLSSFDSHWKQGSERGYQRLHVMRKMLLFLDAERPGLLDTLTLGELCRVAPDVLGVLRVLDPEMPYSEVSRKFGVPPLLLSCWACLAHDVPEDLRPQLQSWTRHLLFAAEDLKAANDGMSPSIKTLVTRMTARTMDGWQLEGGAFVNAAHSRAYFKLLYVPPQLVTVAFLYSARVVYTTAHPPPSQDAEVPRRPRHNPARGHQALQQVPPHPRRTRSSVFRFAAGVLKT